MTSPSEAGVPIPSLFHSVYLEGPFETCIDCGIPLLRDDQVYSIQKVIVGAEAVFEMALCLNCMMTMRQSCSQETALRMQQFVEQRLAARYGRPSSQLPGSAPPLLSGEGAPPFTWEEALRDCQLCGKLRELCRRYEIVGVLVEDRLVVQRPQFGSFPSPIMICDDCNRAMGELVSKKTRESWDRFMEEHFDGPPGVEVDSPSFQPALL